MNRTEQYKRLRSRIRVLAELIAQDVKDAELMDYSEIKISDNDLNEIEKAHNNLYLAYLKMPRFYLDALFKGDLNVSE